MGNAVKRLVFQPPVSPTYANDPRLIWLHTRRGENIPSFFINREAPLTILFSHGNAEDLGMIINYFREVSTLWRVNVFAYEYIGYGLSTGVPSEAGVYESIEAAFDYMTSTLGILPRRIVLYGRSLGTGACCHLACTRSICGMVLQSPLLSVHRVGLNTRFTLFGDMFCNINKIRKVGCPVFIIHGTKDEIVPVYHGMELYKYCKFSVTPFWVEGGGHNNLELLARREFFENVARFIRFLESSGQELVSDENASVREAVEQLE